MTKYILIAIVQGRIVSKLEVEGRRFLDHICFPQGYYGADKIHYLLSDTAADICSGLEYMVNAATVEESDYDAWSTFLDDIFEACEMSGDNAAMIVCVTP
jgi:hypothetical protein